MKRVFTEIILRQKEQFECPAQSRSVILNPAKAKVQTIVGPRRAGKSSLLKLAIDQLIKQGVGWDKICFVTFEDERLMGDSYEPDLLLQAFAEMYPENPLLKDVTFF